ncbi:hypothetical protein LLT6_09460 [Lactococcus cremoris subsp. cremoris TIFN6]|uniref:Uncharacterized protein n=1 Tax=Lactococcus cremoris subsp. cremoris TIFN6 TaxID=1234876 RepID=T0SC32_LACLC|nr:hypothetical protein LLT6_09460 [Lactococcus cremoris subsp. cremoris TIFN6]
MKIFTFGLEDNKILDLVNDSFQSITSEQKEQLNKICQEWKQND